MAIGRKIATFSSVEIASYKYRASRSVEVKMISSEQLKRYLLLSDMDSAFLQELALVCEERSAEKGEWLFHEGDDAQSLFLIAKGNIELKINLDEKKGILATLNTLGSGEAFGWSALFEPNIYKLGALVVDNTELIQFDGTKLRSLVKKYPEQGFIFMQRVAQGMAERARVIREELPALTFRHTISNFFLGLSIATGILVVVFFVLAIYGIVTGEGPSNLMPVFCIMFPVGFYWIARLLYQTTTMEPMHQS